MWITLRDPEGPNAGTIAPEDLTFDETRERYARFTADVTGNRDDWEIHRFNCQRFMCRNTFGEFPQVAQQVTIQASLDIADVSANLGPIAIPAGTEFTLTQRLTLLAEGPRGEGFAEAIFCDPTQGGGFGIRGSEFTLVPEPSSWLFFGAGIAVLIGWRVPSHRRVSRQRLVQAE